jgi:hypothetical protein
MFANLLAVLAAVVEKVLSPPLVVPSELVATSR